MKRWRIHYSPPKWDADPLQGYPPAFDQAPLTIIHFPMINSAQVVETSVTTTDKSPSQNYTHPDDQITLLHVIFFLEWNDEIDRYDNWILRYALGDIEELFSAELEESSTSITACLKNVLQSTSRSNSESAYSKENTIYLTEKVWKGKLQPGILSSSRLQSFCVAELCDCSRKFAPSFWLIICNHFPTLQDL